MPAIKTPTYSIARFLVPVLELITTDLNNVKTRFKFAKEIAGQDPGLFIVSLDAEFLFTNIPLEETLNVCCDSLFSNDAKVNNINRIDFEKLLRAALENNFFLSFSNCWNFVFFKNSISILENKVLIYYFFYSLEMALFIKRH